MCCLLVSADIGGNLGLCVGASLLTVAEFVEFLVMACYFCCKRMRTVGKLPISKQNNTVVQSEMNGNNGKGSGFIS